MTRKPTLHRKQGNPTLFDHMAVETISIAPHRIGDLVRYRRPARPELPIWHSQGIGAIARIWAAGDNYDTAIYDVYIGHCYVSMLQLEHLELLRRRP